MTTNKIKPLQERLARLFGAGTFKDPREGLGGGSPILTNSDVASALALCRREVAKGTNRGDVGPECLETYWGSTLAHEHKLCGAYLAHVMTDRSKGKPALDRVGTIIMRHGAALGVRMLAGAKIGREMTITFAWLCCTRQETMRDAIGDAYRWYHDQMDASTPALLDLLRAMIDKRLVQHIKDKDDKNEELLRLRFARVTKRRIAEEADALAQAEKRKSLETLNNGK